MQKHTHAASSHTRHLVDDPLFHSNYCSEDQRELQEFTAELEMSDENRGLYLEVLTLGACRTAFWSGVPNDATARRKRRRRNNSFCLGSFHTFSLVSSGCRGNAFDTANKAMQVQQGVVGEALQGNGDVRQLSTDFKHWFVLYFACNLKQGANGGFLGSVPVQGKLKY